MTYRRNLVRAKGQVTEARPGNASPSNYERVLVANDGDVTITVAQLQSGLVIRSGLTGADTDTSPTAALILAALPEMDIGDSVSMKYVNTSAQTLTLAGGTDVTASGNLIVLTLRSVEVIFIKTSATEMDMVAF